jgi:hypothetical protein
MHRCLESGFWLCLSADLLALAAHSIKLSHGGAECMDHHLLFGYAEQRLSFKFGLLLSTNTITLTLVLSGRQVLNIHSNLVSDDRQRAAVRELERYIGSLTCRTCRKRISSSNHLVILIHRTATKTFRHIHSKLTSEPRPHSVRLTVRRRLLHA